MNSLVYDLYNNIENTEDLLITFSINIFKIYVNIYVNVIV
jgi:hypothetical protein